MTTHEQTRMAVLTGSSRGIGREILSRLARDGYRVIVLGRTAPDRLEGGASSVEWIQTDLAEAAAVDEAAAAIAARTNRIDLVVHNAGVQESYDFDGLDVPKRTERIVREMQVNLTAPLLLTAALLPLLHASRQPRLVCVGSGTGYQPKFRSLVYSVSKAGLAFFARALARQAPWIEVCELIPAVTRTGMTAGRPGRLSAPDEPAEALMRALARPRLPARVWVGRMRAFAIVNRLVPRLALRLVNR